MKRMACDKCGASMTRLIAYWRCPDCGHKELIPRKGGNGPA